MRRNLTALFLVLLFPSGVPLVAQSPNGSITGIVLDPDTKSIADAEIIAVNNLTGLKYVTSTNGDGIYSLPNLPPGPYRIQVSKVGFKAIIKPDIILHVQDALSINFKLPIGAASIVVTVPGGAPMINTTDASVSTVVDRQFAENLPLNGRSFQTLIYLTPGVVVTTSSYVDNGQFSVNGQRAASNYWTLDGVSANIGMSTYQVAGNGLGGAAGPFNALGGTNSLVSVDAMQEFRIQTSTFAPEFGRTPGGQISIVTRSGTNFWHGSVFDYLRNSMLDANNWFNTASIPELPKAEERQNDFGGTLNGRILRDKTFFFFSYEGLRLRLPATTLSHVPDLAARENATPAMQPYMKAFPLPNGADDVATGVAAFNASYSNPASLDAYSLRIDHKFSNSLTLFGRYSFSPSEFVARGGSSGFAALSVVEPSRITTQAGTMAATWMASPEITNDLRFNYSHVGASSSFSLQPFQGAVPLTSLPFPDPYTNENSFFGAYIFNLDVGEYLAVGRGTKNVQRQINIVDGFTWQRGSHSVKAGVDYRRLSPIFGPSSYQQSAYFATVQTAIVGNARQGSISSANDVGLLFHNLGTYVQDTWRVNPRLTITYGLRWDIDFAPSSAEGPSIAAATGYSLADLSRLAIAPAGTPPFKTQYDGVAPRIGLTYQAAQRPNWETVFRGGVGVFYDLVSAETGTLVGQLYPPLGTDSFFFGKAFPFTPGQIAPPSIPSTGTLSEFYGFNPNLKLPYTLQWNVALEQALGKDQSFSLSYVGAAGRRLLQTSTFYSPLSNPALANASFIDNTASSDYNALQAQYRRRLLQGLQVIASYTFAHSIDDASASSYGNSSNLGNPGNSTENRASSDFDIRDAFTAGATYDIACPGGNELAKVVWCGWSTESFILARSAPPVDLSDSRFFETEAGVNTNIRPDVVPGQPHYLYGSSFPGGKALNPAAFQDPPVDPITGDPTRQGNLGRNALRGFGATQWDLAVHRDFPIHESIKLQFRTEMFNVLNHPNFGPPDNEFGVSGFGLSRSLLAQSLSSGSAGQGSLNPLYQIGGPRSIQVALKLVF